MRFIALLMLIPSIALAEWKVEVLDKQTRETKSYLLDNEQQFDVPLPLKEVFCFSAPQKVSYSDSRFTYARSLQCDYLKFSVLQTAVKISDFNFTFPSMLTINKDNKEFVIILNYI